MVAILRQADMLVSSRFHAVVLALGGGVPAVGVSLDERIATLLADAGAPDRVLPVDPAALGTQLAPLLAKTWAERASLAAPSRAQATRELAAQGRQGMILRGLIAEAFEVIADRLDPVAGGLPVDALPGEARP
jgi:polysaccharide pyruvyl transferase WcaK-like protein